ncbi:cyclase family protein [Nakamurella alba]
MLTDLDPSPLEKVLGPLGSATVHDLARPYRTGMPQSPNHPKYTHALTRRHGDMCRADGASAAADIISMGTHVGTHMDAVAHVSQDGKLFGGADAATAQTGGLFTDLGIHAVRPLLTRGLLLDVPAALGLDQLPGGHEITVEQLDATFERQGVRPRPGDAVLIRSGWGKLWDQGDAYVGHATGVPGISTAGAEYLASFSPSALGADSIAFEMLAPGAGHGLLPAHRVLLVEHGINLIETMDLEGIAAAGDHEFLFVAIPLHLVGATGSPVRPLAVVLR